MEFRNCRLFCILFPPFAILIVLQLGYLMSVTSVVRAIFLALILPGKNYDS